MHPSDKGFAVRHRRVAVLHSPVVPTTRPRYTFTDTGELEEMLDLAARAWPEVADRKELLYRLARIGEDALRAQAGETEVAVRRARQRTALARAAALIDVDELLSDAAWQ
jgi:hypothetical protein